MGGGPSPTATNEMLTIGAFSKRSRLSLKALRLYDEMALLRPAAVDPSNGYRYYGEDQLVLARLIGLLRRLEMPLAQIAEVVALDGDAAIKSVGTYWQGVETDLRTATTRATGSASSCGTRKPRNLSEGVSAQWASSTITHSGRRSARSAQSQ